LASDPPSLRRRGPARLDLALKSGRSPGIIRRRVHLRAGQTLVVQVVPQNPAARVDMTLERPLVVVVPTSRIDGGPVPMYHAELTGHTPLRVLPLPTTGRLHVVLGDGLPNPCRVTIPVTVWPSRWGYVLWWLLAFLGLLGVRWQATVASSRSVQDIASTVWGDLPYVVGLLALGFLILIPLWALWWLLLMTQPGDGADG
jgi:hypothetical protein